MTDPEFAQLIAAPIPTEQMLARLKRLRHEVASIEGALGREPGRDTERRDRYRLEQARVLEHVSDAVVSTDTNLVVRTWNPAAERLYGYAAREVVDRRRIPELVQTRFLAGTAKQALEQLERFGQWHGEVIQITNGGREVRLSASVSWITNREGTRVGLVAVMRDLTAIRQAEERSARLQRELSESRQRAELGSSAEVLAHEIGNPLYAMGLQLDVLEQKIGQVQSVPSAVSERVQTLRTELCHLQDVLKDFRNLARPLVVRCRPTDLCELLQTVHAAYRDQFTALGVEMLLDLPSTPVVVAVDRERIRQVIVNLAKNAAEAMPAGGTLTLKVRVRDGCTCLEVLDTGEGVPAGLDVFEPFVTTKEDGSGFGLSIARKCVVAHGGTIQHHRRAEGGTRFEVVLPTG